ncbi:LacI family DNA-binding transcriptional regulator [Diplocloster hominis]|uniref:LacI family DNA-binding transcriptional regulator n=1 Tax=Diplocloster hominis TaxID=3079010 RepID=UPI0031BAE07E
MATIFDVAKEAGVSKSTVSRVINKDPKVKAQTRIAVEQAIRKLNYSPSYFAKGIRTGRTKTIAMLVPEYTNVFYGEMFRGVEDVALKYGYVVLVCNTERHTTTESEYIEELLKRNVDGIIYNTYDMNPKMVDYLKNVSEERPVVFMDETARDIPGISYVFTDGFASTRNAVHYLYELGKKKIGYVRNAVSISVTESRYQGYLQGLRDCGLPFYEEYAYRTQTEAEQDYIKAGAKAAHYYAGLKDRPDSVMTAIDLLGIGCLKEFRKLNIQVPRDINIIGYDNISLSELMEPSMTTIAQPTRLLGQRAAEILIRKLDQSPVEDRVVFEGTLIIRETTDQQGGVR